jgi:hypothetical protein
VFFALKIVERSEAKSAKRRLASKIENNVFDWTVTFKNTVKSKI